jgi:hypothetical protein
MALPLARKWTFTFIAMNAALVTLAVISYRTTGSTGGLEAKIVGIVLINAFMFSSYKRQREKELAALPRKPKRR